MTKTDAATLTIVEVDQAATPETARPRPEKRGPGRPRGTRTGTRPAAATPSPRRPAGPDYASAVAGLGQVAAAGLAMAGLPLDAWAVATHVPGIGQALHDLATTQPAVAAVLDKILAVGPYGAVIAATLPLFVQIAHNHKMIGTEQAVALGAVPRDQLAAGLAAAGEQMAESPPAHAAA